MRVLEKASLFGMDITPRAEYREHIEYLNNKVSGLKLSLAQEREATESWKDKCMTQENELIGVRACKAGISQKNVKLQEEAVNLRSGMEKLQQDINKAEDRAQEYKDKFTLKSQELTELEAIRERESKQYEERIAKLERELRAQQQAYIEIATVHDEEKNKLEALMEATGCAPYPTTPGKPQFRVPSAIQYPVVDIDKTIPDEEEGLADEGIVVSTEFETKDLPGMAEAVEMDAFVVGMNKVHQECMDKAEKLFYGDDDGECGITAVEEADEAPLPSSPYYEGAKPKR